MDMKKILENMDSAAAGEKPAAGADNVNDMKTILESIQSVDECGMGEGGMPMDMPSEPEDKMSMNVSLNARGDAVEDLIKLIGGKEDSHMKPDMPVKMKMPAPSTSNSHDDMAKLMTIASAEYNDDDMDEEWDNAPDEKYADHNTMTQDLSGGINRQKKMYAKSQDGDNAMALEDDAELMDEIKATLRANWDEKLGEEELVRGIQSNGSTVNFNIDKTKPKTVWKKGADTMTLYATPDEIAKSRDLKGWQQQKPAAAPQTSADSAAGATDAEKAGVDGAAGNPDYGMVDGVGVTDPDGSYGYGGGSGPAKAGATEYTVVAGDNLTKIAKANNTSIDAIAKLNGIKDVNKINVGQKLKIPANAADAAADKKMGADNAAKQEPGVVDKAQDAVGGAVDAAQDAIGAGSDTTVGKGIDAVQGAVGGAVDTAQDAVGSAVDKGQELAGDAADAVSSAWDSVKSWAADTFGADDEAATADTPTDAKKALQDQMAELQAKIKELEAAEQKQ